MAATDAEQFETYDLRTHVEKKGMWAGATSRALIPNLEGIRFVGVPVPADPAKGVEAHKRTVGLISPVGRQHTPALLKAFDELVVNTGDHAKTCRLKNRNVAYHQVTYIDVSFAKGVFQTENDGPGIPPARHAEASAAAGRDVYTPEVAFCHLLSGTNMSKEADLTNVKGGINGVGAKIANIHSTHFKVETVSFGADGSRLFYTQRCADRMRTVKPPVIVTTEQAAEAGVAPARLTPRTTVTMMPAYAALGYPTPDEPGWAQDEADLLQWLRLRCFQLAAYLGPGVAVRLNGKAIPCQSLADLAQLYVNTHAFAAYAKAIPLSRKEPPVFDDFVAQFQVHATQMRAAAEPYAKHPWEAVIVLSPLISAFTHSSIINGVVTSAGPHINYIRTAVKEAVHKQLHKITHDKGFTPNVVAVTKRAFLLVAGAFPGAQWTGQRKDELSASSEALANYTLPAAFLRTVAPLIAGWLVKETQKGKRVKPPSKKKLDKYTKARTAKPGSAAKLMAAEGDSAIALLKLALALGAKAPGAPTLRDYGVYSLGGVPMNAAKKVTEVEDEDGATILVRSKELQENEVFRGLAYVLGLDYGCTYATAAERAKLNYAGLVACVDQDVDGAGKILGIVLTWFHLFWPELLRAGYVQWFMTPVIRVYPAGANTEAKRAKTGPLQEFFFEREYLAWAERESRALAAGRYLVRYYKGLGGHDKSEAPGMFRDFAQKLYTFTLDDLSAERFNIHFGPSPDARKRELQKPLLRLEPAAIAAIEASRAISCTTHMDTIVKEFKLDALKRQLPGALDGLNEVRRKALFAARIRFARGTAECKTFQLAGFAADTAHYHHGSSSMEGGIIKLCQTFAGARTVPLLLGAGSFGTRANGGADAASPRYTSVGLNKPVVNALFPPEDDWLYPYVFVDGERAEPESYVPVVSLAALETVETPSEGWNVKYWARRPAHVFDMTRAYCDPSHPGHGAVWGFVEYEDYCAAAQAAGEPAEERNVLLARLRELCPLDINPHGTEGEIFHHRGKLYQRGLYTLRTLPDDPEGARGGVITVTDLPLRVWPAKFAAKLLESGGKPTARAAYFAGPPEDLSGDDKVRINLKLAPGALALIRAKHGNSVFDPVEDMLKLHTTLSTNINVIRPVAGGGGGVISLGGDYHQLVLFHLRQRKRYYRLRYERRRTQLGLLARVEREILRYIDCCHTSAIDSVASLADEKEAARMLAAAKFPRVCLTLLRAPRYATIAELQAAVVEAGADEAPEPLEAPEAPGAPGAPEAPEASNTEFADEAADEVAGRATYNYILNLRERDLVGTAFARREAKLAKIEAELREVEGYLAERPFAAASVWRRELDAAQAALEAQGLYN